jgi:putative copper export protein
MADVLFVTMRWLHFVSMAALIGGILFARLVMTPASRALAPDAREALADKAAAAFRPFVVAAMTGLGVSGLYNFLTNPGHRPLYHLLLGIKLLLAFHVFAATVLATQPENPRRAGMLTGAIVSGLAIIAIAAYLRRIF